MAANSIVGDEIWQEFKLIQAFMVVLVNCKNNEDSSKNERNRVLTTVLLFKYTGPILPNFIPMQDFIAVLVNYKNEDNPRVLTLINIDFSDAQGQLTQYLVMGSGRKSNSPKLLQLPLLPARIMKIH